MALNEIGVFLTNFRNQIGESLRTMAMKLDISATYLSAIENNKRNIPADFIDKFVEVYKIDEETREKLEKASLLSSSNFKIDISDSSEMKKELLYSLANSEVNEHTLEKLSAILKENSEKKKKL